MKSKKNLKKVLCIVLATASVSSAVAPVSCAVGPEPCAVGPEHEILNGLLGMNRDVVNRLLQYVQTSQAVRNFVGMTHEQMLWRQHWFGQMCLYNRLEARAQRVQQALAPLQQHVVELMQLPPSQRALVRGAAQSVLAGISNVLSIMWPGAAGAAGDIVQLEAKRTSTLRAATQSLIGLTNRLYTQATRGKTRRDGMQPRTAQQIADAVAAATRENQNPAAAAAMLAGGVGVFLPANPDELVLSDLAARECLFGLDIIIAVLYGEGGLA